MSVVIVDYGVGNVKSLANALEKFCEPIITNDCGSIFFAEAIVLPGVGKFGSAIESLKRDNLYQMLKEVIQSGKPTLGICLGMQLLFTGSEESPGILGLDIVSGEVKKLDSDLVSRIPNIGWLDVDDKQVYFCHSYVVPAGEYTVSWATYNHQRFVATLRHNNVWGFQFHPEKSGIVGLGLLEAFVNKARNKQCC